MDLATCLDEGVYSDALTRGKRYRILAHNNDNGQIKVQGDNGRARWFPCYCFDLTGGEAPTIVRIDLSDLIEESVTYAVEVGVELSDEQRRWCFFVTPELLSCLTQADLGSGRLLMYNAPHMIAVSVINRDTIERALRYIDSQNQLLACTAPIVPLAVNAADTDQQPDTPSQRSKRSP